MRTPTNVGGVNRADRVENMSLKNANNGEKIRTLREGAGSISGERGEDGGEHAFKSRTGVFARQGSDQATRQ